MKLRPRLLSRCVTNVGVYHGGIEFRGREWSYGHSSGAPGEDGYEPGGVYECAPRANPAHEYRESLELGSSELSAADFAHALGRLRDAWRGERYDLCHRNCVHFCAALAAELGVGPVPEWVNCLAHAGAAVEDAAERLSGLGATDEEGGPDDARSKRCCFFAGPPRHGTCRDAPAGAESATTT